MTERYQVVIVGGGSVGVGLAVELGQRGISTALVERHLEPQRIPQVLSSGRNVFEELSPGFTLLALGADETAVAAFEQAASVMRQVAGR